MSSSFKTLAGTIAFTFMMGSIGAFISIWGT